MPSYNYSSKIHHSINHKDADVTDFIMGIKSHLKGEFLKRVSGYETFKKRLFPLMPKYISQFNPEFTSD